MARLRLTDTYNRLISFLSGPQECTYSIDPHHMNIRAPSNVEDDDIEQSDHSAPLSVLTVMSYTLCRLRIAEISRQIADETATDFFQSKDMSYDQIDRKLRDSLNDLPEYFRFGQFSQRKYAALYRQRPTIAWQRCTLQLGYYFQYCRLHRRYFIRGAKDPAYSNSHVVCLQSARTMLELKRMMDEEEPVSTPCSSHIWVAMSHCFTAAAILLIDVCFNWEDILAVKRRAEVIDACRLLTPAQRTSTVARKAVDEMMAILQKH